MKVRSAGIGKYRLFLFCFLLHAIGANAQSDADGIMMTKNNFCVGATYSYSSWKNYWEGTLKRNNENLGKVSNNMVALMGSYGISKKLNVLFSLPYVSTKASGGTLHGQKGLQDLSLWIKWMPIEKEVGAGMLSLYTIGGFSVPLTNYVADFQPLSIGMHSKNLTLRVLADYQAGDFFATVSGSYVVRSKVKLDRTAYYTTEMHYTNEVSMPDAAQFNFRIGYRTERMIAEALLDNWTTLGGFDITRNNMPFPSNKMNMTAAGIHLKYYLKAVDGLSVNAGGSYTLAGRNVGQATAVNGGVFYILDFTSHKKDNKTPKK